MWHVLPGVAAPLQEGLNGTAVAVGRGQVLPENSQPLVGLVDELGYVVRRRTGGISRHAASSTHHYTERVGIVTGPPTHYRTSLH